MHSDATPDLDAEPNRQAAEVIAPARRRVGFSQRELVLRLRVPGPVVNAIERSRRQPSVPTLAKLLRGIGLELRLDAVSSDASLSGGAEDMISRRVVSNSEKARAR